MDPAPFVSLLIGERQVAFIRRLPILRNLHHLSTQRSELVEVLVSRLASPTFTVTLNVIRSQLQARNYQLLLGDTDYSSTREDAILRALLCRQVDGLILASAVHTSGAKALLK